MGRAALLFAFCSPLAGCTPELGDAPFACSQGGACPEGYSCQSAVCVADGASPAGRASRLKRVTWINSGEMFWLEDKGGGATLVVNDGFSPGGHGLYAIRVAPDGSVSAPSTLLAYSDQFPMASSVVGLSDGRYGVVTLSFPGIDEDKLTLKVLAIARDAPPGAAPGIETLYTAEEDFLGGAEPAYVGAVAGDGTIDLAWTRPTKGGSVEVLRLERQGALWQPTVTLSQPLDPAILPLSGDCFLWKVGGDKLVARVGFETFTVASIDMAAQSFGGWVVSDGLPIFAWDGQALVLRYGDFDEASASARVSYALTDLGAVGGMGGAADDGGVLQDGTDMYAALPHEGGALFAPMSSDPSFPEIGVGFRSPTQGLTKLASVKRESTNRIYSARAFASQGKAYVAWTEFHESLMDLWVATAPLAPVTGARVRPAAASRVEEAAEGRVDEAAAGEWRGPPVRAAQWWVGSEPARRTP